MFDAFLEGLSGWCGHEILVFTWFTATYYAENWKVCHQRQFSNPGPFDLFNRPSPWLPSKNTVPSAGLDCPEPIVIEITAMTIVICTSYLCSVCTRSYIPEHFDMNAIWGCYSSHKQHTQSHQPMFWNRQVLVLISINIPILISKYGWWFWPLYFPKTSSIGELSFPNKNNKKQYNFCGWFQHQVNKNIIIIKTTRKKKHQRTGWAPQPARTGPGPTTWKSWERAPFIENKRAKEPNPWALPRKALRRPDNES